MAKEEKLTGYALRQRLRKARKKYPFTATEQALYQELIDECNEDEWSEVFQCANEDLCRALNITEKTLIAARQTLIQQGLIFYSSGKSKRAYSSYSFTKALTTVKIPAVKKPAKAVIIPANATANVTANVTADSTANASDYNKEQTESKTEDENKSGAGAPGGSEKKDDEQPSLYSACITIYDGFVRARTEMGPKIDGRQGTAMKNIIGYLTTQAKAKQPDRPPEEVEARVKDVWSGILENWHLLTPWQQGRLQLSDINSEMTNILTAIKNGTNGKATNGSGTNRTGASGQQANQAGGRGASINELQGLKRGAASSAAQRADGAEAAEPNG